MDWDWMVRSAEDICLSFDGQVSETEDWEAICILSDEDFCYMYDIEDGGCDLLWYEYEYEWDMPSSVYCEENWWTLNLEEGSWLCIFDDGTYCEEWSYYRNECQKWDTFYNMVNSEWTEWDNIWMANPAAVFCVEQWGESYSLVDNEWNETWMCRLPDWNEVDEWGYYYSHN